VIVLSLCLGGVRTEKGKFVFDLCDFALCDFFKTTISQIEDFLDSVSDFG
jgi:hypothetical protein